MAANRKNTVEAPKAPVVEKEENKETSKAHVVEETEPKADEPEAPKAPVEKKFKVMANGDFNNGGIVNDAGVGWKAGEVREVTRNELAQLLQDNRDNWEIQK